MAVGESPRVVGEASISVGDNECARTHAFVSADGYVLVEPTVVEWQFLS
jgi:hypothetical protein